MCLLLFKATNKLSFFDIFISSNQFKFFNEILLWAGFSMINQNLRQNCTKIIIARSFV